MEAQAQLRLSKLKAAVLKLDLLILDEVGLVPFSKVGVTLFGFLADRYERGSVLVTSNLDFASWTEIFGDPRLNAALLDRLTQRANRKTGNRRPHDDGWKNISLICSRT